MVVCKQDDYIARGAHVHSNIWWIQERDEGSKFYFDFLKKKVGANKVLGLCRVDGSLAKYPSEVRGMLNSHFQNIFASYASTNVTVVARDACCRVVPHKVSSGGQDRWESG
jgi:hypothetical protein